MCHRRLCLKSWQCTHPSVIYFLVFVFCYFVLFLFFKRFFGGILGVFIHTIQCLFATYRPDGALAGDGMPVGSHVPHAGTPLSQPAHGTAISMHHIRPLCFKMDQHDLRRAPYVLHGVKYIDLVSLHMVASKIWIWNVL